MITSSSKLSIYGLVPTLVTLRFEIGQPLGCQGGNFLVATAKSEDGFRKAQQLTEEATETPRCGLRKRPPIGRGGKPTKPIDVLEPLDLGNNKGNSGESDLRGSLLPK